MSDYYMELEQARAACSSKERDFALSLASGLTKEAAFCQVFGQKHVKKTWYVQKRVSELLSGNAGKYYGLLMHPLNEGTIAPYALARNERLYLLSMGAVLAYQRAQSDPDDSKSLTTMKSCIHELNKMTGEHAPDKLQVQGTITTACIHQGLSEIEATEMYKRIMQGARLAHDTSTSTSNALIDVIEYEPIVK